MKDEWFDDVFTGGYEFSDDYFTIFRGNKSSTTTANGLRSGDNKRTVSKPRVDSNHEEKTKVIVDPLESEDFSELKIDLFDIQDELAHILLTKHADYGSKNISDAPGGALNGIRVRMHDKIARLNNLIDNNKKPNHESIRDTLIDIANYATIAIMVIDDKWDK